MWKIPAFLYVFLIFSPAFANDCLDYKIRPSVYLESPEYKTEILQPDEGMEFVHGHVVATMTESYNINVQIQPIKEGWCVSLKQVDAVIGYENFNIQIDKRHALNSCTYNAVLEHEHEHVNTYLSVFDDMRGDLKDSIYSAADSIMPIFVKTSDEVNNAITQLNEKLQSHPDVVLIKQKIKAAEEIRNKKIDEKERGENLKKCFSGE